jgi:hypothetical protein
MKATHWPAVAAAALVLIGSLRIISTYQVFNHTIDEPDNLAAGMEYLSTGRYLYEDTHPPLARVFGAIGPFLAGERFHRGPASYGEGYRILGTGAHYDRVLALGRAGILPFFWIGSLVVYLWTRRAGGTAAAAIAVLLFSTIPPVLGLSGVINTDAALYAMTGAAALGGLYWAERPDRRRSVAFGALLALAAISKFSSLPFLTVSFTLMIAVYLVSARRSPRWLLQEAWARRASLAWVAGTAALAIWAAYGFTFARVDPLHMRLPAPRFFSGIHSVLTHNRRGHPSYLMGMRSPNGFWYYFPAVLAVKTPLALFGLLIASAWLVFRGKRRRHAGPAGQSARPTGRLEPALALAFALGIVLGSMAGHIDIGVRFVLPAYIGFCVVAGCAAARARAPWAKTAVALLIAWQVASGALQHPDYLAYTNEIAGSHPERFVADSDLDWGQDMKRLASFLQQQGARSVTFTPFNRTYPMPVAMMPGNSDAPSPGWNAVSVTIWKVFGFPAWADRMPPQKRIGRSILLWYVLPGAVTGATLGR